MNEIVMAILIFVIFKQILPSFSSKVNILREREFDQYLVRKILINK